MLNACLRCSTIFAGFFTLIQALLWAVISIYGVAVYECNAPYFLQDETDENFHEISVSYLLYITYLRGSCRNPELYYEAPTAKRAYTILMTYSIISSIWVPTAVLLLVGTCVGARGRLAKWIYVPWLVLTTASCLQDIIATVKFSIDISETTTTANYLSYMNITSSEVANMLGLSITTGLDGYTVIPSIILTILASRAVVLWFINFFFLIFGIQGFCAFSKKNRPQTPRPFQEYMQQKGVDNNTFHQGPKTGQWIDFTKPEGAPNQPMPPFQPMPHGKPYPGQPHLYCTVPLPQEMEGKHNPAFVADEPLRLEPVEVEVKQEKNNYVHYAEIESIELESNRDLILPVNPGIVDKKVDSGTSNSSESGRSSSAGGDRSEAILTTEVSVAEEAQEEEEVPPEGSGSPQNRRRVYDAYGNPTEERLTPEITRIQKIIKQIAASQKGDMSGFNTRPFSYTQPQQPQIDSLPKKNDTVRGMDKPPIPVPDYSVRVTKKPSLRTSLPIPD